MNQATASLISKVNLESIGLLTNTIAFTFTEPLNNFTYQDRVETTAVWDVWNHNLHLPAIATANTQIDPDIVVAENGDSYVVWLDNRNGVDDPDIYAQRFDENGRSLWQNDIRINSDSQAATQTSLNALLDSSGNLIVVWADDRLGYSVLYGQKLNADGDKLWMNGDKRLDAANLSQNHHAPRAARVPNTDTFIIVWHDSRDRDNDIYMQWADSNGMPKWVDDFRVNLALTGSQVSPSVSTDAHGNAYVAWLQQTQDYPSGPLYGSDIYAQKIRLEEAGGTLLWEPERKANDASGIDGASVGAPSIISNETTGDSYIVWNRLYNFVMQSLGTSGNRPAQWTENKQLLRPDESSWYFFHDGMTIANDASLLMTWTWFHLNMGQPSYYILAQKLDATSGESIEPIRFMDHSPLPQTSRSQSTIATNMNDNTHIAWVDERNGENDIFLQGFSDVQATLWPIDIHVNNDVGALTMIPKVVTGSNNDTIVLWADERDDTAQPNVYAQHLNETAVLTWPPDVRVTQTTPGISRDDWMRATASMDANVGGETAVVWQNSDQQFFLQHLNPDGSLTSNNILVGHSSGTHFTHDPNPDVALDDDGFSYVVWQDYRRSGTNPDIFMQKLNATGTKQWASDIRVHHNDDITHTQTIPAIALDRQNNHLYVVWEDSRDGQTKLYLQKLDRDGNRLCSVDTPVSLRSGSQYKPTIAAANGYAYMTWQQSNTADSQGFYAQKIDGTCQRLWGDEGIVFSQGTDVVIGANLSSGTDTVYVAWRGLAENGWDIFAQHLNPDDGTPLWTNPVRVNSDSGWHNQSIADLAVDTYGMAHVVWNDNRQQSSDVFIQKLRPDGSKVWAEDKRINPVLYHPSAQARSLEVDVVSSNITWAKLTVSATVPAETAVFYELSNNGGSTWEDVMPNELHLFTSEGSELLWRVTLQASPDQTQTPTIDELQIVYGTEAPLGTVYVLDEAGLPVAETAVYHNGRFAGNTNDEGTLIIDGLQENDALVALKTVHSQPTVRDGHADNAAFHIYGSNVHITTAGEVVATNSAAVGETPQLVVRANQPLILFNLVVSIEWDATEDYIAAVAEGMQGASDYIFDLSDGQMAFGQVAVYDNGELWGDADIQIAAKNIVRPHARISGILSEDKAHVIRVGRGWDGSSGNQGSWAAQDGFRTLTHEFGHYALHLYDEYIGYQFDANGKIIGEKNAYCTAPLLTPPEDDSAVASAMYSQYYASELSAWGVAKLWSALCEETAQWQLTQRLVGRAESAWETIARMYRDDTDQARWQLTTPMDRGAVLAGPTALPANLLAMPQVTTHDSGTAVRLYPLAVYNSDGLPQQEALVSLYTQENEVIGQGFTDGNGRLDIYGAIVGDSVRATTMDGSLAGHVTIGNNQQHKLCLAPAPSLRQHPATSSIPHLAFWFDSTPVSGQVDILLALNNFGIDSEPRLSITEPNSSISHNVFLTYSPTTGAWEGKASLAAAQMGVGQIRGSGIVDNRVVRLQTTYRLQRLQNDQAQAAFASDGNVSLQVEAGSLLADEGYLMIAPTAALPAPPPAGLELVGDVYRLQLSDAVNQLEKTAVFKLGYDTILNHTTQPDTLAIYRWNGSSWQIIASSLDEAQKALVAPITHLGIYALFAPKTAAQQTTRQTVQTAHCTPYTIHLPLITLVTS
ncbi:MAG: hypothetical protein H6653_20325 [Ardenticatenaceae bacterium]|nr:hypothetical protein [Ardenticatenaceae bacterium]